MMIVWLFFISGGLVIKWFVPIILFLEYMVDIS